MAKSESSKVHPAAVENKDEIQEAMKKIQREKEKLKKKRMEEEEQKKQEERERLLHMMPTKHKEEAGGGDPADMETKTRRETVKKVK